MLQSTDHSVDVLNPANRASVNGAAPARSRRAPAKSPQRSLMVLQALTQEGRTLAQLARQLNTPKTSLLIVLRSLCEAGHIAQNGLVYELGPESLVLAHQIVAHRSLPRIARPILVRTAAETGETAVLTTLTAAKDEIVHLDKVASSQAPALAAAVGDRRPLYCTAGGLLLLSHQSDAGVERYIKTVKLQALASNTITNKAALRRRIRSVARAGVCVSINQSSEGFTGIAAPIYDHDGSAIASLVIAAPSGRVAHRARELCEKARAASLGISRLLGYPAAQV
jgi:DNA-binding IclR family transcriptional regulator